MLDVLSVKLINGCNLACRGCSHMSQFATASSRIDIDQLKKDLIEEKNCYARAERIIELAKERKQQRKRGH